MHRASPSNKAWTESETVNILCTGRVLPGRREHDAEHRRHPQPLRERGEAGDHWKGWALAASVRSDRSAHVSFHIYHRWLSVFPWQHCIEHSCLLMSLVSLPLFLIVIDSCLSLSVVLFVIESCLSLSLFLIVIESCLSLPHFLFVIESCLSLPHFLFVIESCLSLPHFLIVTEFWLLLSLVSHCYSSWLLLSLVSLPLFLIVIELSLTATLPVCCWFSPPTRQTKHECFWLAIEVPFPTTLLPDAAPVSAGEFSDWDHPSQHVQQVCGAHPPQPSRRPCLQPHRRCLPQPPANVPFSHQLLHHWLVQGQWGRWKVVIGLRSGRESWDWFVCEGVWWMMEGGDWFMVR